MTPARIPHALLLNREDPDLNMRRFYRIERSADLFGGVRLTREWGRTGTRGHSFVQWYATEAEAEQAIAPLLHSKLRRGYLLR